MQITTKTSFSKENYLNIPLAIQIPTAGSVSQNNGTYIDLLCARIERELLLNALGLDLYNEFQIALSDINNIANAKWKLILNGEEYSSKLWRGLKHEMNFIEQRIYEVYVTETNSFLTQAGNVQVNSENANLFTPVYKIANSNQEFIKGYQGQRYNEPMVSGIFVDYFGSDNNGIDVSFYQYLLDKKILFPTWISDSFKFYYEEKNSFGI